MKDLTPIEILEKLDAFYNNAWDKLLLFTTIMLAIIGIVYPIIINWLQNRNLKLKEESLKKEMSLLLEVKFGKLNNDLVSSIEEKFEEKIKAIKEYQEKIKSEMEGAQFHLQANAEKDPKQKLINLIWSAQSYLAGEDFMNLNIVLEMIIETLPSISKDDLSELEVDDASISNLIEDLTKKNHNDFFTNKIRNIKKEIKKIENKNIAKDNN